MYKILVIDDESEIANILKRFLVKMGFEVEMILGGEEAIKVLRSGIKPDLVTLDMKMPKVGGFRILEEMHRINLKVPVIILTGSLDAEQYENDLIRLGYSREDIVYKPVDLFAFLNQAKKKLGIPE